MVDPELSLDEIIYNKIKVGKNTVDDILYLKNILKRR